VLDEPTSSVDVKTEASIIDGMRCLMKSHTSFSIGHRLGRLEHCGLLMVIERGWVATATSDAAQAIRSELALRASLVATDGGAA